MNKLLERVFNVNYMQILNVSNISFPSPAVKYYAKSSSSAGIMGSAEGKRLTSRWQHNLWNVELG